MIRIELLGVSFAIDTDEDPAHVERIVDVLRTRIQEVDSDVDSKDPLKIALLAGMLVADEMLKDKDRAIESKNITTRLIKLLDQSIDLSSETGANPTESD